MSQFNYSKYLAFEIECVIEEMEYEAKHFEEGNVLMEKRLNSARFLLEDVKAKPVYSASDICVHYNICDIAHRLNGIFSKPVGELNYLESRDLLRVKLIDICTSWKNTLDNHCASAMKAEVTCPAIVNSICDRLYRDEEIYINVIFPRFTKLNQVDEALFASA